MSIRAVLRATVALVLSVVVLSVAGQAGAVGNPDYTSPPPAVVVITPGPRAPAPHVATPTARTASAGRQPAVRQVQTAVVDRPMRSRMPVTGTDVTMIVLAGLALTAAGAALLTLRRRFSGVSPLA